MMKAKPYILLLLVACLWMQTCTKNNVAKPSKATLVAPAQNSVCLTGNVLSTTQSAVTFSWQASANTDSYTINLKNLVSSATIQQQVTTNTVTITLDRGAPYSWSITSNNSGATIQSDVWKFYNSGLGITSYAPFPADLTSPTFGQTVTGTSVTLTWTGSDPDNDIATYDVYFGTAASPASFKTGLTASSLAGVAVTSGNTYYWKVVTHDSQSNTSTSDIYQFTVK